MKINTDVQKINKLINRGVEEIIDKNNLVQKLTAGKKLRIKLGIDPTAPDLHLGHAVVLRKLRQFQDLGHTAVLIIGDFTTLIGDPSGRTASRPKLTPVQIRNNMKDYIKQASKIININSAQIHYNSEWFGKQKMSFLMDLTGHFTIARLIEREDFQKRLKEGFDVSMLELLYPLLQGYDSVAVNADVELGGRDQRLNLLFGRKVQRAYGQPEQDILTVPLLIGTDGAKKMSKSAGNYIAFKEKPLAMFKKIMEISDALIWEYFSLLTDTPENEIADMRKKVESGLNPKEIKLKLAREIVSLYNSPVVADAAQKEFIKIYIDKSLPQEITPLCINSGGSLAVVDLVFMTGAVASKSAAKRFIAQNAVKIDGVIKNNWQEEIQTKTGQIIQIGKDKFFKIQ